MMFRESKEHPASADTGNSVVLRTPKRPRLVSLFAGIGGFDRAFEAAGAEPTFLCESDRFCRAVLRRHWPNTRVSGDIRTLKPDEIPEAEVWTAGFPCQDVSLARGNHGRSGLKGNHTSLFFRLMELVDAKRPKVILLENVVGLLNSHGGQDFAIILRELTAHGYAVSWRVMNARYFGAPQSRARVFLCAWLGDYHRAVATLFEERAGERVGAERKGFLTECFDKRTGAIVPQVAYCVAATSGRHTGNDWSRSYISYVDGVRRPTPTESERLQGFPPGWTIPHDDFAIPARGVDSERYKAVGNAVAIPVVEWIAKRLLSNLAENAPAPVGDFVATVRAMAPDLQKASSVVDFEEIEDAVGAGSFTYRWKSGGCAFGSIAVEGTASQAPSKQITSSFVDALDPEVPEKRYFLTPNAAAGILRRADTVGRNLFPPMRKALVSLVEDRLGSPANSSALTGDDLAKPSLRSPRSHKRGQVEGTRARTRRSIFA